MTKEFIKDQMSEIRRINQATFRTFYLRYTSGNRTCCSNKWGKMSKFENVLKCAENSSDRVGDSLPIELLVLIDDKCVHCWIKNPLWDGVNCLEEDSHVYANIPLIGNHWFVDPKDWLDIDNRNLSEPARPAETPINSPMIDMFLRFFKKDFKRTKI